MRKLAVVLAVALGATAGTCPPPPIFEVYVDPSSVLFSAAAGGGAPPRQLVRVNMGLEAFSELAVDAIRYAGGASGWLTTATLDRAWPPATLTLQPTPGSLAAGTYVATVPVVASSGDTAYVGVVLVLSPPPSAMTLSRHSVTLGAAPGARSPQSQVTK